MDKQIITESKDKNTLYMEYTWISSSGLEWESTYRLLKFGVKYDDNWHEMRKIVIASETNQEWPKNQDYSLFCLSLLVSYMYYMYIILCI